MTRWSAFSALLLTIAIPAHAQDAAGDEARVALIERAKPSIVHVKAIPPAVSKPRGAANTGARLDDFLSSLGSGAPKPQEGSGFVVDSKRGLIATAAHIIGESKEARVILPDGSERLAMVAGRDEESGLAVLRTDGPALPALAFDSGGARAGETALVVGWMIPVGSVLALEGMVMGPAPVPPRSWDAAPALVDYVALDVALPNGGFGGSPVLDRSGAVVGVVSAILGRDYGPGSLTLMIPAGQIAPLIDSLAAGTRLARGQIGIGYDCEAELCRVTAVDSGSPAEAAGLKAGDRILRVDGAPVTSDRALRRAIAGKAAGSIATLQVDRGGASTTIGVPVTAEP